MVIILERIIKSFMPVFIKCDEGEDKDSELISRYYIVVRSKCTPANPFKFSLIYTHII